MSETSEITVRVAPNRAIAEEWALVLVAEGLSPSVRSVREGFILGVPTENAERATAALFAYERENPTEPEEGNGPVGSVHVWVGLAVAVALVAFFFVSGAGNPGGHWFERGGADARRILLGELWRTVTALTLHADFGHVAANAVAGAFFLSAVCRFCLSGETGGRIVSREEEVVKWKGIYRSCRYMGELVASSSFAADEVGDERDVRDHGTRRSQPRDCRGVGTCACR